MLIKGDKILMKIFRTNMIAFEALKLSIELYRFEK